VCGPITSGLTFNGDNINNGSLLKSSQACLEQCLANTDCVAWNYIAKWDIPECWLHGAGATQASESGIDAGTCSGSSPPPPPRTCGPVLTDRSVTSGFNIGTSQPGSAEECQAQCLANPNCTCWNYIYDWATPQCFLHGAPATLLPGTVTGEDAGTCDPTPPPPRTCGPVLSDRSVTSGFNIGTSQPGSAQACQAQCLVNPNCTCWNYIYDWATPQCFLHGAPATLLPGTVTGEDAGTCDPNPLYKCVKGECVQNNASDPVGMPLEQCQNFCLSPNDKYLCAGDGICVESVDPTRGTDMQTCMKDCKQQTPGPISFECSLERYLDVTASASCNDACIRWCDAKRVVHDWHPESVGGYIDLGEGRTGAVDQHKVYGDATMLLADDVYCKCVSKPAPLL
jgi:hypothetical protein